MTARELAELAAAPYPVVDPVDVDEVPGALLRRYKDGELDRRTFWRELLRLLGQAALSDEDYFEGLR